MEANYRPFCERLIKKYEGGYCWDKGDPGGPTKYGITCFDYAAYKNQKMHSMSAWAPKVRAMTLREAQDIYITKYAKKTRFNELNSGKDTVMFDYGVNSGPSRPIRVSQKMLKRKVNGVFDDSLLEAINACDTRWFINGMKEERLAFMHAIRGGSMWKTFGRGWLARVNDLTVYSLNLATVTPMLPEKPLGPAKGSDLPLIVDEITGLVPDIIDNPKGKATSATDPETEEVVGGGSILTGVLAALGSHDWGAYISSSIGMTAVLIGFGYLVYSRWKSKHANETVELPPSVLPQEMPLPLA